MIPYLTGSEYVNHSLMNDLYEDFDSKMKIMLSSGKSFIFAVGDGSNGLGDWDVYPLYKLLGQRFAFYSGTPAYADKVGANTEPYDHSLFTNTAGEVSITSLDDSNNLALINNIYDSLGASYYSDIGRTNDNFGSYFDYSLEAHKVSGYYFYELWGNPEVGRSVPEKHYNYALADVFIENLTLLEWKTNYDKYKCLRFHNLNSTERVTVSFQETSQNFNLNPLECLSFRNHTGIWEQSSFNYFQEFKSGDPLSYWFWPRKQLNGTATPYGKGTLYDAQTPFNSQCANNLLNPSIVLDFIETLSYKYSSPADYERTLGSYYPLNAYFNLNKGETGFDITHLYCLSNAPTGVSIYKNTTGLVPSGSNYYNSSSSLAIEATTESLDIYTYFPSPTQPVTLDLYFNTYGAENLSVYGQQSDSSDWQFLSYDDNLTGWNGKRSVYIDNNGRYKNYKLNCNFYSSGVGTFTKFNFNGLFENPSNDSTLIGDLFIHKGELIKAKVSRTKKNTDNFTPLVEFETILFNGFTNIYSDFTGYQISVEENAEGQLVLGNLDPDNYVDLIPVSTNLLKNNSFSYSISSGFNPVKLDEGFTIDNRIWEKNYNLSVPGHQYPPRGNNLNYFIHQESTDLPPVLISNIFVQTGVVSSGNFSNAVWSDITYPAWSAGTYPPNSRVTQNKNRYVSNTQTSQHPTGGDWHHISDYAEPFDAGLSYSTGQFYAVSGAISTYGYVNDYIVYAEQSYGGIIEGYTSRNYAYNYVQTGWVKYSTYYDCEPGAQYATSLQLQSDTAASLKNFAIYGYNAAIATHSSISNKRLYYEPEGLTLTFNENISKQADTVFDDSLIGSNYFTNLGYFIDSGASLYRKRKAQFRGNGFGYKGMYIAPDLVGANATSFFLSPRFGKVYSEYGPLSGIGASTYDYFDLIDGGDIYNSSGRDFSINQNVTVRNVSKMQTLHRIDPQVFSAADTEGSNINFTNSYSEFAYYKNDQAVENCYFDKDALEQFFTSGYFYAGYLRLSAEPLPYNARRFYSPVFSEHYNLWAQYSNAIDSASVLNLADFITWNYSGETFRLRTNTSSNSIIRYPDITDFNPSVSVSYLQDISYPPDFGILPKDHLVGFYMTGANHSSYFRQFFISLGVAIHSLSDFGSPWFSGVATHSGRNCQEEWNYTIEGTNPSVPIYSTLATDYRADLDRTTNLIAYISGLQVNISSNIITGTWGLPPLMGYASYPQYNNYGWVKKSDWVTKLSSLGIPHDIIDAYVPIEIINSKPVITNGRINHGNSSFLIDIYAPTYIEIADPFDYPFTYNFSFGGYGETGHYSSILYDEPFPDTYYTTLGSVTLSESGTMYTPFPFTSNFNYDYIDTIPKEGGNYKAYTVAGIGDYNYVKNDKLYNFNRGYEFLVGTVGFTSILIQPQRGWGPGYAAPFTDDSVSKFLQTRTWAETESTTSLNASWDIIFEIDWSSNNSNKFATIRYTPSGEISQAKNYLSDGNYVMSEFNASNLLYFPNAGQSFSEVLAPGVTKTIKAPGTGQWLFAIDSYSLVDLD